MMIRRWFPLFAAVALPLVLFGTTRSQAGSFFGPCCYGAAYAQQFPNRGHVLFGSASGCQCPARHPLCRRIRCKCGVNPAAPCGDTIGVVPAPVPPAGTLPAPVTQAPPAPAPVTGVSVQAESLPPLPLPSARVAPSPAPLPSGPPGPEFPSLNQGVKPPF